jgi:hypothetical protein
MQPDIRLFLTPNHERGQSFSKTEIKTSSIHGDGLFASGPIEKHACILQLGTDEMPLGTGSHPPIVKWSQCMRCALKARKHNSRAFKELCCVVEALAPNVVRSGDARVQSRVVTDILERFCCDLCDENNNSNTVEAMTLYDDAKSRNAAMICFQSYNNERSEFEVDKTLSSVSSKLRTINEATDGRPNCVVFISYSSKGILRDPRNGLYVTGIGLCSLRAISANEELTISYGKRFQYSDLPRQTSQHFFACKVGKYIAIKEDLDNVPWVIDTLSDIRCTSSSADLKVLTTVLNVSLK